MEEAKIKIPGIWGESCLNRPMVRTAYALQASLWRKMMDDMVFSGLSVTKTGVRRWWNPLRYIRGPIYVKRVAPADFWR